MRKFTIGAVLASVLLLGSSSAYARQCTRLPLSDIAFGKEATIKQAHGKLDEYAARVAKQRGWTGRLSKSNRKATCSVWLNLGPFGTEYRCRVTATYCAR